MVLPVAVRDVTRPLPMGAVVTKENYKPTKELAAITAMVKAKGYNPDGEDWWWAKYGPDGKAMKEGKVAGCRDCGTVADASRDHTSCACGRSIPHSVSSP